MANTNINIRMDADLKRQFEAFCADMGMTMTTAYKSQELGYLFQFIHFH